MARHICPSPVVLLAGAGASRPFDMPTMVDFREQFAKGLDSKQRGLWMAVIDTSSGYNKLSPVDIDIEHVLTCIEDCELSFRSGEFLWNKIWGLTKGRTTVNEVHELRQSLWDLRNMVLDRICSTYGEPTNSQKVVECYDPLFKLFEECSGQEKTNVFTTNYDLAFEALARSLPKDYEVADGFQAGPTGQSVWVRNYVPPGIARHSIVLWKLHGSTSWLGDPPAGEIVKGYPSTFLQGPRRTVLVYPTKKKRPSQRLFAEPFSAAYARLDNLFRYIGAIKIIVVIGYRFGDLEVKEYVTSGMASEGKAIMIVVDPNAQMKKVSELLDLPQSRLRIVANRFGEKETLMEIRRAIQQTLD